MVAIVPATMTLPIIKYDTANVAPDPTNLQDIVFVILLRFVSTKFISNLKIYESLLH